MAGACIPETYAQVAKDPHALMSQNTNDVVSEILEDLECFDVDFNFYKSFPKDSPSYNYSSGNNASDSLLRLQADIFVSDPNKNLIFDKDERLQSYSVICHESMDETPIDQLPKDKDGLKINIRSKSIKLEVHDENHYSITAHTAETLLNKKDNTSYRKYSNERNSTFDTQEDALSHAKKLRAELCPCAPQP